MSHFTPNQRRAIAARGNVLVQAGAGAGKTRTLVERCVSWLLESDRNSLDQILMVTFTEAAAAEMRLRIRTELTKALERQADDRHLTEQLALLDTAPISTLHSFCFQLVRQHFYELELDPQLSVLAEAEARLLQIEVLTEVLRRHYAGELLNSAAVQELIQVQARGWERPIRRLVLRLHEYTQTLPAPAAWFRDQLGCLNDLEPCRWAQWLREILPAWRDGWLAELGLFAETPAVAKCIAALESLAPEPTFAEAHAALKTIEEADATASLWPRGSKGKVRKQIEDFFEEAEFLESLLAPESGGQISARRPACEQSSAAHLACAGRGDTHSGTRSLSADSRLGRRDACPTLPLREDWEWSRGPMITLLQLAQEFAQAFAEEKRELGVVDFHDLEQLALRLLWDSATQQPTPLAEQWRGRLQLIFVDEYQDINAAQDAILRALGRDGAAANRFLVGDVKQSIYRFRLANPRIFQNYAEQWGNDSTRGQVIPLSENFRSHEAILGFVNAFFDAVMRKEAGGVEFGPEAWLRLGSPETRRTLACAEPIRVDRGPHSVRAGDSTEDGSPNPLKPHVELHLRLTGAAIQSHDEEAADSIDGTSSPSTLSSIETEVRMIGLRLRELVERRSEIWDEHLEQFRPVEWSDIVILLRSRQGKIEPFAKEFSRLNIPLIAPQGGFFESTEVMDLLNLLKLLDNPLQDIETVAVLRSPLVGLTLDELAAIRLAAKGERFWKALQRYQKNQSSVISGQRSVPSSANPAEELKELRSTTDNGPRTTDPSPPTSGHRLSVTFQKLDRFLKSFSHWRTLARQTSLSQCLEQVLNDTHYPAWLLSQPRGEQRQGNIRKLLAWARQFDQFHRQGLFRFLRFIEAQQQAEIDHEPAPLETGNAVRLMSIHQSKGLEFPVVVVADLGKAFNLSDLNEDIILDEIYGVCPQVKPPMAQQRYPSLPYWLAQRRQRTEALGEEMRILYVAMTRARNALILAGTISRNRAEDRWPAAAALTTRNILQARSYLDWIGPCLPRITARHTWHQEHAGETPAMRWVIYDEQDSRLAASSAGAEKILLADAELNPPDDEAWRALRERLSWNYPHAAAVQEPAKASVSALRRRVIEDTDAEAHLLPFARPAGFSPAVRGSKLSAADLGTAHHLFLQFVSLESVTSLAECENEARRLEREGILSGPERAALDLPGVTAFWQSEVGQKIWARRTGLHRELAFTARLSWDEIPHLFPKLTKSDAASDARSTAAAHDEFIVVQGAVDLVVLLPEEIWLLDFKTDAVTAEDWSERARAYTPQLKLYGLALNRIYRKPVTQCWLHFLALRRTVECSR